MAVYTDGSKTFEGTGSACIAPQIDVHTKRKIDSSSSVYTAECVALNDALDIALDNSDRDIYIFTDSLSALQTLQSAKLNIKTNSHIFEIKQKYNEFKKRNANSHSITLYWIPAHKGIKGNDEADSLAKSAARSALIDSVKVPYTDFYEGFKSHAKKQTMEIAQNHSLLTGKNYFVNYWKDNQYPWFSKKKLDRTLITTVNRIRANHYNLASSLARINIVDSSRCKCNTEEEDINHVLWQCPLYDLQREGLIKKLHNVKYQLPLNVEMIASEPDITACQHILSFLKKCNLKI